jgi:hypothetical protein
MEPIIPLNEISDARVYWRCYSDLPRHKKLWRLPDHNARWAWIVLLCAASETNGVFESDQHLQAMIGSQNTKYLPHFRRVGLLDGLVVHDWDEWQEPADGMKAARESMALAARDRLQRLGLRDNADTKIQVRSLKEWLEYVVSGPNSQGRLGEFMWQMLGIAPQKNDYARLAKLMREFPGGIPLLMSAICDAALRDLKGDPIAYLIAVGQKRRSAPTRQGGSGRDSHLEE